EAARSDPRGQGDYFSKDRSKGDPRGGGTPPSTGDSRSGAGTRASGGEACGPAAAGAQAQERACRVSPVGERAGMLCAAWPYPLWIAHRGAGRLAPENTLAAFALGHGFGYRMFECDARLSADGEVFLLHDDRL